MGDDVLALVERELSNNSSPDEIRKNLLTQGFLEDDIDNAISKSTKDKRESKEEKKIIKRLSCKEVLDRIGYGFVPQQFINILFYLTGANFFWLGTINGARAVLSIVFSSILQELAKVKDVSKGIISKAGYLYGFSFFGMAVATLMKNVPLFALFLLIGSVGVVLHGDLYNNFVSSHLKREKRSKFLAKIGHFGVLITAATILVSGWLLDKFPVMGNETVSIAGKVYPLYGYLISFEITAIAFILSGYFLAHIPEKQQKAKAAKGWLKKYWKDTKIYLGSFLRNPRLFLLISTTVLFGVVQALGNSYYGVYIYEKFNDVWLGGFLNVAVIYTLAVVASFFGPWFTKAVHKFTGLAPTLVFGTLLTALMPLALAFNPNLPAIGIANALAVLGAAILGVSQGMLVSKLLREDERRVYFGVASTAAVIPFVILIPLGAWYAQTYDLIQLFKILIGVLVAVVAPLYLILVLMSSKRKAL